MYSVRKQGNGKDGEPEGNALQIRNTCNAHTVNINGDGRSNTGKEQEVSHHCNRCIDGHYYCYSETIITMMIITMMIITTITITMMMMIYLLHTIIFIIVIIIIIVVYYYYYDNYYDSYYYYY